MNLKELDSLYTHLQTIHNAIQKNLVELSKKTNLSVTELLIVLDIKNNPNTNLNALCMRLGIKKSLASKTVHKLVDSGVISKCQKEKDSRNIELILLEDPDDTMCKNQMLTQVFKDYESVDFKKLDSALQSIQQMLSLR